MEHGRNTGKCQGILWEEIIEWQIIVKQLSMFFVESAHASRNDWSSAAVTIGLWNESGEYCFYKKRVGQLRDKIVRDYWTVRKECFK